MWQNAIGKLAQSLVTHPKRYVTAILLLAAAAGLICLNLHFDSSYEALLPENSPKLKATDQVRELTGGFRQLVLAVEGSSLERLALAEKLALACEDLPEINRVELKQPVDFFTEKALWFLPEDELKNLNETISEAIEASLAARDPLNLGLMDEEEAKEEEEEAWQAVNQLVAKLKNKIPQKNPYLESSDGRYLFLVAVPSIKFSDMQAAIDLLNKIEKIIASLEPQKQGISVSMAGNLKIVEEQHETMTIDLTVAAVLALLLSVLLVAIFTKKIRAPFLIALALLTGIALTMALTTLTIGNLNIITGFLISVIVGLGIDFGIHIYIRYKQELKAAPSSPEAAMEKTVKGTFTPALIAALTTMGTFFSFYFAEFRGFSEFGLIATIGVAFTFISSFLLLPPLLVLLDKKAPLPPKALKTNKPLLTLKRSIIVIVLLLALSAFGWANATKIEFRNDYKNLRGVSAATAFLDYVDNEMGGSLSPAVLLFDSLTDTQKAAAILREEIKKETGGETARVLKLFAASDLLPLKSAAKEKTMESLRDLLLDEALNEALNEESERGKELMRARQMVKAEPWTFNDLPPELRARFSTKNGQKYLLYLWPHHRYEADYEAAAWEELLEKLSAQLTAAGLPHLMADETLILAWVYKLILHDSPKVLAIAALITLLFLLIDLRSFKKAALVATPLILGLGIFFALMRLFSLELNMFNIIVLPSMIGIGIDNAIHIYHRYKLAGPGQLDFVLRSTGVAAFLATSTTIIGFGSSIVSHMPGLRSLGILAIIGLSAMFLSAVVFFPALLKLLERK